MARQGGRSLGGYLAWPFLAFGRYSAEAFNLAGARAGARDIRLLWSACRGAPPQPEASPTAEGVRDPRIEAALWQSAWAVRVYAGTAGLVWWAWVAEALVHGRFAGPFTAVAVLLLIAALGLRAFHEALRNWQVRTGLPGGASAFLAWNGGPLWPPLPRRPR